MKKALLILVASVMVAGVWGLTAGDACAQVKIGTVDVQKIRDDAPRFKEALEEIDDMVADFERRRDRKQAELQDLAEGMEQAQRIGGATLDRQRAQMNEKYEEFQQFMEETFGTEGIIENKSAELLAPLYADLATAGKKVAGSLGLDLILDLEQINPIFAGESLDVTDALLAEFVKMR